MKKCLNLCCNLDLNKTNKAVFQRSIKIDFKKNRR